MALPQRNDPWHGLSPQTLRFLEVTPGSRRRHPRPQLAGPWRRGDALLGRGARSVLQPAGGRALAGGIGEPSTSACARRATCSTRSAAGRTSGRCRGSASRTIWPPGWSPTASLTRAVATTCSWCATPWSGRWRRCLPGRSCSTGTAPARSRSRPGRRRWRPVIEAGVRHPGAAPGQSSAGDRVDPGAPGLPRLPGHRRRRARRDRAALHVRRRQLPLVDRHPAAVARPGSGRAPDAAPGRGIRWRPAWI